MSGPGFELDLEVTPGAVKITNAEVRMWSDDPAGPVMRMLDELGVQGQMLARGYVRVRTARLQNSIRKQRGTGGSGPYVDIVAGIPGLTDYLGWEHDGTRPHLIRARNRRALRFTVNGQVRFATKVRHPGTTGSRFLLRALEELAL